MAKSRGRSRSSKPKATRAQPFLMAALFCQQVLEEKEGVATLVRVLDVLTVPVPREWPPEVKEGKAHPAIPVTAFVAFKSGEARGERDLQIDLILPSGERETMAKTTMVFLGEENGVNVKAGLVVPVATEALYWYEVLVDGVPVTRMPLRISHAQPTTVKEVGSEPKPKKGR